MTPKRFNINKSDRKTYEKLRKSTGPLQGRPNPELFILAVTLGFYKAKIGVELESRDPFIHDYNLSKEQWAIVNSVAVCRAESLEVLADKDEVIKIAEEYAAAGLPILESMVNSVEPDFIDQLESEMVDYFDSERMESLCGKNITNRT